MPLRNKGRNNKKTTIMKLNTILISSLALLLPLTACSGTGKGVSSVEAGESVSSAEALGASGYTKTITQKEFNGLKNSCNVEVNYKKGNACKVVATFDDDALYNVDVCVEEGKLVVKSKKNTRSYSSDKSGKVVIDVTAPYISSISNSGICKFTANGMSSASGLALSNSGILTISTGNVRCDAYSCANSGQLEYSGSLSAGSVGMNNSGALNMNFGNISSRQRIGIENTGSAKLEFTTMSCQTLKMKNSGSFDYNGAVRVSGDASLGNYGICTSKSDYEVGGNLSLTNSGSNKLEGKIKAKGVSCNVYGSDNDDLDISAESLNLKVSGILDMDLKYKGGDAELQCYGSGNVDMDLDCRSFKASNSGSANITLRGTSDQTDIKGRGISHIDASGLNRY